VKLKKAIFLDRDGVIIKVSIENGIPHPPESIHEVEFCEGAISALQELKNTDFEIIVVTNQPDVARGKTSLKKVLEIHNFIEEATTISKFYICPHDDSDGCMCRKPLPGLLRSAADELNINLKQSIIIGDRWKDITAGQAVGCTCFFINANYSEKKPIPPFVEVKSLRDAVNLILEGGRDQYHTK
jgi:D-glycero-D-manno-heptose 1,7-bisphosphate phosphatase